jgi:hypothetical protein
MNASGEIASMMNFVYGESILAKPDGQGLLSLVFLGRIFLRSGQPAFEHESAQFHKERGSIGTECAVKLGIATNIPKSDRTASISIPLLCAEHDCPFWPPPIEPYDVVIPEEPENLS